MIHAMPFTDLAALNLTLRITDKTQQRQSTRRIHVEIKKHRQLDPVELLSFLYK
jgi:hypothetical protein